MSMNVGSDLLLLDFKDLEILPQTVAPTVNLLRAA